MAHQIDTRMRECIDECQDCHAVCVETAAHCLTLGGKHASPEHQTLLHRASNSESSFARSPQNAIGSEEGYG